MLIDKDDSGKEKKVIKQQKKLQDAFNDKREVEVIPAKISDSYIQKKRGGILLSKCLCLSLIG